jgi:hypothetical protein
MPRRSAVAEAGTSCPSWDRTRRACRPVRILDGELVIIAGPVNTAPLSGWFLSITDWLPTVIRSGFDAFTNELIAPT